MRELHLKISLVDGDKVTDLSLSKWQVPDRLLTLMEGASQEDINQLARDAFGSLLGRVMADLVTFPTMEWDEEKETAADIYEEWQQERRKILDLQNRIYQKFIAAMRGGS